MPSQDNPLTILVWLGAAYFIGGGLLLIGNNAPYLFWFIFASTMAILLTVLAATAVIQDTLSELRETLMRKLRND